MSKLIEFTQSSDPRYPNLMRALSTLLLVGCCPRPQMEILEGSAQVGPGEIVQLRASHGGWQVGPGACGGHWYVDEVLGGSSETGTVDSCGRYEAPEAFPEGLERIEVLASEFESGTCADCCPYAFIELFPTP
jgi:hypothetical protein